LGDGTKAANLCNRNWEMVRNQVLRDHPWNFAMKRTSLAPSGTGPSWGFTNAFPLPADYVRLIEIRDLSTEEYVLENNQILANDDILYIRYVYKVADSNKYDASFIDAVATRLAVELCEALTQSNTKKELLFQEYDDSLTRAKRVDGQENPPVQFEEDEWINVRY
jgi:hypothetical protein